MAPLAPNSRYGQLIIDRFCFALICLGFLDLVTKYYGFPRVSFGVLVFSHFSYWRDERDSV